MLERIENVEDLDGWHLERYRLSQDYVADKDVLDAACGIGYGSNMLLTAGAKSVTGIDISADTIAKAQRHFGGPGITFDACSCLDWEGSHDVVVSLETIEHLEAGFAWPAKIASLLRPQGTAIISTPLRSGGSLADKPANPHHVREWNADEFHALLSESFSSIQLRFQGLVMPQAPQRFPIRAVRRELKIRRMLLDPSPPVLTMDEWFDLYQCRPVYQVAICSV